MFKFKTYYGLDAPYVVYTFFSIGITLLAIVITADLGFYWPQLFIEGYGYISFFIDPRLSLLISGFTLFVTSLLMIISSFYGKYIQCNRFLDLCNLNGSEKILDIGCGRGLLLIEAAHRLTTGKAIGIDIWNAQDLSNNNKAATLENIKKERVESKAELYDADARNLPFDNETFDRVISSMVIHNISPVEERKKALAQMVRVLKPEGIVLIQDFRHSSEYAQTLKELGLTNIQVSSLSWFIFPPVRIVSGYKKKP